MAPTAAASAALTLAWLVALLRLPAPAAAFLDRDAGHHLFALPELHSPLARHLAASGAGYRHVTAVNGAYPELHDSHAFTGSTRYGFVVFNATSVTRNTTVQSDDYAALLADATLACAPAAGAAVRMAVAFPVGVSDGEALAHLAARLALPGAVLALGVQTLLRHPSLHAAGSCVRHVPSANPYFEVLSASASSGVGGAPGLALELLPTHPSNAFAYLRLHLEHSPDGAREVARRRAAGLYVGRELAITGKESVSRGVNWNNNAASPAAATASLPLFSSQPNALYCSNCYFYLQATLNVDIKVCGMLTPTTLYTQFYDASLPSAVVTTGKGYWWASAALNDGVSTSAANARARTDCEALGTGDPKLAVQTQTFNLGMDVKAYFTGSAGFGLTIRSDGIPSSTALALPVGCTSPSSACAPADLVAPVRLDTITLAAGGLPVTLDTTLSLQAAAAVTFTPQSALNLQLGASAIATLKLGGGVAISKVDFPFLPALLTPTLTPTMTTLPFVTFNPTYNTTPLILSGFTASAEGLLDVTLVPRIDLVVWKVLPFTITPAISLVYGQAPGSGRALRSSRALSSNACPAGQVATTATAFGALGVRLGTVTAGPLIKAGTGLDLTASPLTSAFNALPLIPSSTSAVTFSTANALPTLPACLAVGALVSLPVAAPAASPSPAPAAALAPSAAFINASLPLPPPTDAAALLRSTYDAWARALAAALGVPPAAVTVTVILSAPPYTLVLALDGALAAPALGLPASRALAQVTCAAMATLAGAIQLRLRSAAQTLCAAALPASPLVTAGYCAASTPAPLAFAPTAAFSASAATASAAVGSACAAGAAQLPLSAEAAAAAASAPAAALTPSSVGLLVTALLLADVALLALLALCAWQQQRQQEQQRKVEGVGGAAGGGGKADAPDAASSSQAAGGGAPPPPPQSRAGAAPASLSAAAAPLVVTPAAAAAAAATRAPLRPRAAEHRSVGTAGVAQLAEVGALRAGLGGAAGAGAGAPTGGAAAPAPPRDIYGVLA